MLVCLFVWFTHSFALAAIIPAYLQANTLTASPFIGITHYQIVQSFNEPTPNPFTRELAIHIVEIDPFAPGISFLGSPGNGAAANEYTRMTTGAFVSGNSLAVGINGDFYSTDTGITANVNGLGMSNGVVVSQPAAGDDRDNSLVVTQNNIASIISNPVIPAGAWNAVSGNQLLLRNGVNVTPGGSYTTTLNPHTAVGWTKLMVICFSWWLMAGKMISRKECGPMRWRNCFSISESTMRSTSMAAGAARSCSPTVLAARRAR